MGESITRLNPKIESRINREFLALSVSLLVHTSQLLKPIEHKKRGKKPYDYRILLVLCILRIMLGLSYDGYERVMRTDTRICIPLNLDILPSKSTIQRAMKLLKFSLIRQFNKALLGNILERKLNVLLDSTGIRVIGRSIWYCIRIGKHIRKRDCKKIHVAVDSDLLLILNFRITIWNRNDCPFLVKLLKPFKRLGVVLADKGYLSRKNFQFVADRLGAFFCPFKKGKKTGSTAKPNGCPAWKFAFNLWSKCNWIYKGVYRQRPKVEAVFSAIKKRYGDKFKCRRRVMGTKEVALRLVAYNVFIMLCYNYSVEHNLPLYVRA
jgi:hypothetical protein